MRTRVALITAGVLIMGYATAGSLTDPDLDPAGVLLFAVAVLVGHDVLWMTAVLATGAGITRLVPRQHRPAVRVASISAAAITFVAFPLVVGDGRPADNPSALPLPYGRNLVFVLLIVSGVTLLTCLCRARRRRPTADRKKSERPAGSGPRTAGR
ncbi:hypothetical protein [Actinoplanes regularis]|uniref:Uncharacterized protein n=1 Tax=Actinoplanes regularis TaxID=52697 RepID=A0A239HCR3_9ACTN|nr:hypothetical protein [Actinoplanes regularis]GIE91000.1 hypothetical protein Are01nite_74800 [Actinoplanes regularis]SNS79179.1 hypothetical protein SAMN06264365_12439 [Actinoplanes regularis]